MITQAHLLSLVLVLLASVAVRSASGEALSPKVEALAGWLLSGDARLRGRGADLLVRAGSDGLAVLLTALEDRDAAVRATALRAISTLESPPATAHAAAVWSLADPSFDVVRNAVGLLSRHPHPCPAAVPHLLALARRPPLNKDCTPDHMLMQALANTAGDSLHLLTDALSCREGRTRYVAAGALWLMGERAAPAVPALVPLLREGRIEADLAVIVLAANGTAARAAVEPLVRDPNPDVRRRALAVLASTTRSASPAELATALDDPDQGVRQTAIQAVGHLLREGDRAAIPALVKALGDRTAGRRAEALQMLHDYGDADRDAGHEPLGTDGRLLDAVRRCLVDPDANVRCDALPAFRRLVPPTEALDTLTRALCDRAWVVRASAARELGSLAAAAAPAVPGLVQRINDHDEDVRSSVCSALSQIEMPDAAAITALTKAARSRRGPSGAAALSALVKLAPGNKDARGLVLEALHSENHERRTSALNAAYALAETCPEILEALVATLPPEGEVLSWHYEQVLKRVGARAVAPLLGHVTAADAEERRSVVHALGVLGPAAHDAIPAVVERLDDRVDSVAKAAAEALVAIGDAVRPALTQARQAGTARARRWAGVAWLKLVRTGRESSTIGRGL